jgi:hypothetical protein
MKIIRLIGARLVRPAGALVAAGLTALVVSCGGGGGAGCSVFDDNCGSVDPVVVVDRLTLVLTNDTGVPAASLPNTGTERITATVTALNASNAVVPNATINLSVDSGAEVTPTGTATNDDGKLTGLVGIGPDRSSRRVTVTARTADGAKEVSASFLITGAKLSATLPPIVAPGAAITARYTLLDAAGNAMVGESVTLSGNGSSLGEATTDTAGTATFAINAPAQAGSFTLTATAAGESLERIVQVQSSSVPPAVGAVTGASVAANPSVVSVNSSNTTNSTTVRALFKGASNAPIRNVRVWFTLPDPNSVGGAFSDTGLVYSDATGTATTLYLPGAISSPTDGVIVLACYSNVDFAIPATPGACPATASDGSPVRSTSATLTVVDEALRLDIGTDELIQLGTGTYIKDYTVVVVDAAGRAKADVEITPKIDLLAFYKGYYAWNGSAWVRTVGGPPTGVLRLPACPNEDVNRNGNLEVGEDTNGNGRLDPGGVTIRMVGSSRTDASGKAVVRIEYPRDRATWIDYLITVTGRVGGSEGLAVYLGTLDGLGPLPAPGDAFTEEDVFPAFGISFYGTEPGCDNAN